MKGKQLTLEEILKLSNGTKVWVESERLDNKGEILTLLFDMYGLDFILEDDLKDFYTNNVFELLKVYEWLEETTGTLIDSYMKPSYISYGVAESMAYEIAKYHYPNQYEYTDEQIIKIIEEFMRGAK